MAQITFTIPDNQVSRIHGAFVRSRPFGVSGTPLQIFRESIIAFIKKTVIQVEAEQAAEDARVAAIESARSALNIT